MLWLAIHFPLLPLEVFHNDLDDCASSITTGGKKSRKEQPVAIYEEQRGRSIISYCNNHAIKKGIDIGMTDSSALALYHDIHFIARDINKEKQLLQYLAETAYQFSSQIVIYTTQHPTSLSQQQKTQNNLHSLLLEISRSLKLFHGIDNLTALIKKTFSQHELSPTGFSHHIANAKTPLLSELLARNLSDVSANKALQQLEHNKTTLDIPITLLDCEHTSKQQCETMGLNTLKSVLQLPRKALGRRFNQHFIQHLNQIDGSLAHPQNVFKPPRYFFRELFFLHGLRNHEQLQPPMEKLLKTLKKYLQLNQITATEIDWRFYRFSKKSQHLIIRFSKAQISISEMLSLSLLQLPQLTMDSPVESIGLTTKKFLPINSEYNQKHNRHSHDLFGIIGKKTGLNAPAPPNGDARLLQDSIQAKLGSGALLSIRSDSHILPERKNHRHPVGNIHNQRYSSAILKSPHKNEQHNLAEHLAPTWLFEKPVAIHVRAKKENTLDVNDKKGEYQLNILKGPQRIETQWWENTTRRDYFIAGRISASGKHYSAIYWVFQDLLNRKWFIQGIYS